MIVEKETLQNIYLTLLIIFFLFGGVAIVAIIGWGGTFGTYSTVISEVMSARYSNLFQLCLFGFIHTVIFLVILTRSSKDKYAISFLLPLLGYTLYTLVTTLYFYDQIYQQSTYINLLFTPFSVTFPAGNIPFWSDHQLLMTRFTEAFAGGGLVYFGFFSALIHPPSHRHQSLTSILLAMMVLLLLLFMSYKVWLIPSIAPLLLFWVPFFTLMTLRKI